MPGDHMHIVTKGIVLRETSFKEADKMLTVLTEDAGRVSVLARGVRRKHSRLSASSQLLVYSDMTLFSYKDHFTLDAANSIEQFWNIKSDLMLLALGSYFAETVSLIANEDAPSSAVLSLLLNSLYALDTLKKDPALVKAAFELRLLLLAGFAPFLDHCAVCGAQWPQEPRLHLSEGILHCAGCKGALSAGISMPLCEGSLSAMRYVLGCDPKRLFSFSLTEDALKRMGDATEAFVLTQLESSFPTLDYYKRLLSV